MSDRCPFGYFLFIFYSPALKKWGLYWICPVCPSVNNDAKRRVYGRDLAKKQKCSVPCSVLFSSRYIDGKKIFRQRFVSGSG